MYPNPQIVENHDDDEKDEDNVNDVAGVDDDDDIMYHTACHILHHIK